MSTHPAEVNQHLGHAFAKCSKLIEDAEKRGDAAGADAWLVARNAIETAERAIGEARSKQNWERKPTAAAERPAIPVWKHPRSCRCSSCEEIRRPPFEAPRRELRPKPEAAVCCTHCGCSHAKHCKTNSYGKEKSCLCGNCTGFCTTPRAAGDHAFEDWCNCGAAQPSGPCEVCPHMPDDEYGHYIRRPCRACGGSNLRSVRVRPPLS